MTQYAQKGEGLAWHVVRPRDIIFYHPNTYCGRPTRVNVFDDVRGEWVPTNLMTLADAIPTNEHVCHSCRRSTRARFLDVQLPAMEVGRVGAGRSIARRGDVREVGARVFRVKGDSQGKVYTVTIPTDDAIASSCTCKDAKINPETMCKHQAAAFWVGGVGVPDNKPDKQGVHA